MVFFLAKSLIESFYFDFFCTCWREANLFFLEGRLGGGGGEECFEKAGTFNAFQVHASLQTQSRRRVERVNGASIPAALVSDRHLWSGSTQRFPAKRGAGASILD